jgi:hypothetical protein
MVQKELTLNGQRLTASDGFLKKHYRRSGQMLDSDLIVRKKEYKFQEDEMLREMMNYIDSTYHKHYSSGKYQATDMIIDAGHGEGFCIGNIMKYAMRFGKKSSKKLELCKIIHYAIIALHLIEKEKESD